MLLKRFKYKTKKIINPVISKNDPDNFFSKYFSFRSSSGKRLYLFALTFILIVGILSYNFTPDLGIKLGEASPKTIKANKSIGFEDTVKTEEDRNRREIEVEDVYNYDTEVLNGTEGVLYQIRYFFQLVKIVSKKNFETIEEKIDYLSNLTQNEYSDENLKAALLLDFEENSLIMNETINVAKVIMKENIKPNDVDGKKIEAVKIVDINSKIKSSIKPLVVSVLQKNIKPTAIFDPDATENARKQARLSTPPHIVNIAEGQAVINEGDIVNGDDIIVLTKLGLLNKGFNWKIFAFIALINIVVLFLFYAYIYKFNKNIFNNVKKLLITSTIIIIFIVLAKLFTILTSLHLNLWVYLFPLVAASMLCSIIFDAKIGIMMSMILAVNFGISANFDYQLPI